MKMVAAAKLKKAQDAAERAQPYSNAMAAMMAILRASKVFAKPALRSALTAAFPRSCTQAKPPQWRGYVCQSDRGSPLLACTP